MNRGTGPYVVNGVAEYEPAEQGEQALAPAKPEYEPAVQLAHTVD